MTSPAGGGAGPRVRFVILAVPRSGSNMLCSMLQSHPDILCHHELFNEDGVFYALDLRDTDFDLGTIAARDSAPLAFLARVWERHLDHRAVGLKFTHRREPAFTRVLEDPQVRKIVLRRNNRVRTWVSRRRAELTGRWEVYEAADVRPGPRVETDPEDLFRSVEANEAHYAYIERRLAATGQQAFAATYEHLEAQAQEILAFLGVPPHPLRARSVKQGNGDLRTLVSDYDNLRLAVSGTELQADLEP